MTSSDLQKKDPTLYNKYIFEMNKNNQIQENKNSKLKLGLLSFYKSKQGFILRWIAFLPLAFLSIGISKLLATLILNFFYSSSGGPTVISEIFDFTITRGIGTFSYVYVGSKIAPKYNKKVAIGLCGIYLGITLTSWIFLLSYSEASNISWQAYVETVIFLSGMSLGYIVIKEEYYS